MDVTLIATTTMGFESVLAKELRQLGYEHVRVFDTKVEFDGQLGDICWANLWCRTAGRIYVKIAQFQATTFDELFEQTKECDWSTWIQKDDQFPISNISSRNSELFSKSDCQAIVKKAIAEQLKNAHNCQTLPETDALFPVRVQIDKDIVTLSIDSSGTGLNKRGYRAHSDKAPLRETLAAGLVLLSNWNPEEDVLFDPCCGTGTLLIEAGLIAKNIAPGLERCFNSEQWQVIGRDLWQHTIREARNRINPNATYRIYGSDISEDALAIARKNIELSGLTDIFVQKQDLRDSASRFERGKLITNPPYGERLSEKQDVDALYKDLGRVCKNKFRDWSYYILTPHNDFEQLFGKKSTKHRKVFNGGMQCWFYQYYATKSNKG